MQSCSVRFRTDEEASLNVPPDVSVNVENLFRNSEIMEYRTKHPIEKVEGKFIYTADANIKINETKYKLIELMTYLINYVGLILNEFRPYISQN